MLGQQQDAGRDANGPRNRRRDAQRNQWIQPVGIARNRKLPVVSVGISRRRPVDEDDMFAGPQ